jgi:hypothetical protein
VKKYKIKTPKFKIKQKISKFLVFIEKSVDFELSSKKVWNRGRYIKSLLMPVFNLKKIKEI